MGMAGRTRRAEQPHWRPLRRIKLDTGAFSVRAGFVSAPVIIDGKSHGYDDGALVRVSKPRILAPDSDVMYWITTYPGENEDWCFPMGEDDEELGCWVEWPYDAAQLTFRVKATVDGGDIFEYSPVSAPLVVGVPAAPTDLAVVSGKTAMQLSFAGKGE